MRINVKRIKIVTIVMLFIGLVALAFMGWDLAGKQEKRADKLEKYLDGCMKALVMDMSKGMERARAIKCKMDH
jgi:hypothetical protein